MERGATEAESTLTSLRETAQRELSALGETYDRLVAWNTEQQSFIDVDIERKVALDAALVVAQKSLGDLTMEVESSRKKVVDGEHKVREEREVKLVEEKQQVEALRAAMVTEAEAKEAVIAARAGLNVLQVSSPSRFRCSAEPLDIVGIGVLLVYMMVTVYSARAC